MTNIPSRARPEAILDKTASDAAYELRLPWRVAQLREIAAEAYETTRPPTADLGLPGERIYTRRMLQSIREQVKKTGEKMERLPFGQNKPSAGPSDIQIREALFTFSVQQWRDLIDGFDQSDVDALRSYLDANKNALVSRLGYNKYHTVFGQVVKRGLILLFSHGWTRVTDAYWAAHIHNIARQHNIEGSPRPSAKRSWAEVGDLNNIAESLSVGGPKVTPYKVKMMLGRMKQTPFEDFDGTFEDYLLWATDPKAYKRHLHARNTAAKPRRDPDPYFSDN
jgi:hypothetical protein